MQNRILILIQFRSVKCQLWSWQEKDAQCKFHNLLSFQAYQVVFISILACRNEEKAKHVIDQIKTETNNTNIEFIQLDMLSLTAVKQFAEEFLSRHNQLHILLNNAGVMAPHFELSKDGIEATFATNHVAHHYLTMLLLPIIEKSGPSRIVTVSSGLYRWTLGVEPETLSDPKKFNRFLQYNKTKACNVLFTRELAKRLEARGLTDVYANCNHPGSINTDLQRHSRFTQRITQYFFIEPEEGALTQLYLATSPEIEERNIKGQYCVPFGVPEKLGGVAASESAPARLWKFTENLLKEKAPNYQGAPI